MNYATVLEPRISINRKIEDMIEELWEEKKRSFKALNSEEKDTLVGLLMRRNHSTQRHAALDESLNEICDMMSTYLLGNREMENAILKKLHADCITYYQPDIDALFDSRLQYEVDSEEDNHYWNRIDEEYDRVSLLTEEMDYAKVAHSEIRS